MNPFAWLTLRSKRSLVARHARDSARDGVLAVHIRSTVGLGAKLEWALEIMAYCHENGLLPQFRFSYPDSEQTADYFGRLFTIRGSPERPPRFVTISSIVELDLGKDYDQVLTIGLAQYLINRFLAVRPHVVAEVDEFCRLQFGDQSVLGVHYRGTDKFLESPPVTYDCVRRNIEHYLRLRPNTDSVFIATDDANFLDHLRSTSIGRPLIWREDAFRSSDGSSVHESSCADKHEMNRDAIVNCLILSRCGALLKTSSILSGWSKLFNPQLPVVMLGRPDADHLWFPESALVRESLFEPVR